MSYATLTEADTYFQDDLRSENWEQNAPTDREKALSMSTKAIDQLNFLGAKTSSTQDNQFPRYDDTSVPDDIKNACIEEAYELLQGRDPDIEFEGMGLLEQGYGKVKTKADPSFAKVHIAHGILSIKAWRLLFPYLRDQRGIRLQRT